MSCAARCPPRNKMHNIYRHEPSYTNVAYMGGNIYYEARLMAVGSRHAVRLQLGGQVT
jgi:hypothetical protein